MMHKRSSNEGNNPFKGISNQWQETKAAGLFLLPSLLGYGVFVLFAVGMSFWLSFQDWSLLSKPVFIGLSNYRKIFCADPDFMRALYNTVYFVIGVVPAGVVVSLLLALLVNQKLKGIAFFRAAFYMPVVTPTIAIGLVWAWLYNADYGLINNFLSMIGIANPPQWLGSTIWAKPAIIIMNVWHQAGYYMVIFLTALQSIPDQVYEAADIDGTNNWQRFFHITLPLLSPTTFLVFVMKAMGAFKIFEESYIMTQGGPGGSTETIVYLIYKHGFEWFRMGYAAAAAWVLFIIIFTCTLIQFKFQKNWVHYE
jgi:multiple sugar transport system permease protein